MKGWSRSSKKVLQGRIESLNKQIKKQEGELQKINEEIKHRDL
jgi:peptidoglycan hydrolase CwlO-like protein